MKTRGAALLGACAMALSAMYVLTPVAADEEIDVDGPLATDQSAASSSEVTSDVTAPAPMAVSGTVGSYTTEVWPPEDTTAPTDLAVVSSTQPGTAALTGVVVDEVTGDPVQASVRLRPIELGITTEYVTGPGGGYAFVNIPTESGGTRYDLVVSAAGYGSYEVVNETFVPNEVYQQTSALTAEDQSDDASQSADEATLETTPGTADSRYVSFKRVPPSIMVGVFRRTSSCAKADGVLRKTIRYPWRFYVLHVAAAEISSQWKDGAFKANFAAQQNYAWFFRRNPAQTSYDVDNTTSYQCFKPMRAIPRAWRNLIGDPDADHDPLENSLIRNDGDIKITQYRAGSYACVESLYPQNGNKLSQWGSLARDEQNCGTQTWKAIFDYYYTGTIQTSLKPTRPDTSFTRPPGKVHFVFPARVKNGAGKFSPVGWSYQLERCAPMGSSCEWVTIYDKGWASRSRVVPTEWTYDPPGAGCYSYRARARNPRGWQNYASFGSGGGICPG